MNQFAGRAADDPVPGRKKALARLLPVAGLRIRLGRLALRLLAAALASALAIAAAGWQPASLAVMTGALTWLFRTARSDLTRDRRS